ncbi:MAG: molybdopterin-guanine dinucleotide biosynthesis protein A [Pseudomonadota bacterium]
MSPIRLLFPAFTVALLVAFAGPTLAQDEGEEGGDRHAGYYYPEPQSEETYVARAVTLPDSDRSRRLGFVTLLTQQQLTAPYSPSIAMFAKGEEAEKLIIVGLRDGPMDTIYRARGVLAMLTASARTSELFRQYQVQDIFTFFDLLKLLGFERLTVTNGKDFAHVIYIE